MTFKLPPALLNSLQAIKGFDETSFIAVHESDERITSIRLNPAKLNDNDDDASIIKDILSSDEQTFSHVPWCPNAYYLSHRPSFTFDPLFHAGVYYVQEASSMFLWQVLKQTIGSNTYGLRVLDLCAAPGGKSTLLASYFKDALIVSNDVIRSRANILVENVIKWGSENVIVTNNDPKDFAKIENYFDVILVDAPCSGSGLFRKDNNAIKEWSEDSVNLCSQRQQRILHDIYPALKQGGTLIYSTCSYSVEEDENILDELISGFDVSSVKLDIQESWNIVETTSKQMAKGYRFYPDKVKGEGFFIAAFKKNDGDNFNDLYFSKNNFTTLTKTETASVLPWLKADKDLFFFKQNEVIIAADTKWKDDIDLLKKNLYLRKAGVALGSLKQKDFVPSHELALSNLADENIPKYNLTKEEAILYLKKKEFGFNNETKGWQMATYLDKNLGWLKILHNRVNNYYPTEWRILKD